LLVEETILNHRGRGIIGFNTIERDKTSIGFFGSQTIQIPCCTRQQ
jgi:hypothetical protein